MPEEQVDTSPAAIELHLNHVFMYCYQCGNTFKALAAERSAKDDTIEQLRKALKSVQCRSPKGFWQRDCGSCNSCKASEALTATPPSRNEMCAKLSSL